MELADYQTAFDTVCADFEETVASFGLPFETTESDDRALRTCDASWSSENSGASLVGGGGWLSPACLACRTGERTATFFISLACPKQCYFCFNPNQEDYEYHVSHVRDIAQELEVAYKRGVAFDCLAITGGEPLLHSDGVLAFLERAAELYPRAHNRLYTSGYGLDSTLLDELSSAGLDEIRFSVKWDEGDVDREKLYTLIGQAVVRIPSVMVETPVIPGMIEDMKSLLVKLDALGVAGINLLEFCFPLHNAQAFIQRGFKIRKNPYRFLYNYWYAGGLPIAESEADALALLRFSAESHLELGVHYCSADNKNSGQFYQQNKCFVSNKKLQAQYPYLYFDESDYLLKCAKAFGSQVASVRKVLEAAGFTDTTVPGYRIDPDLPAISFPLSCVPHVQGVIDSVQLGESFQVLEQGEEGLSLREFAVYTLETNN